jgi:hypothetical protein
MGYEFMFLGIFTGMEGSEGVFVNRCAGAELQSIAVVQGLRRK